MVLGIGINAFSFNLVNFTVDTTTWVLMGYFDFSCMDSITTQAGSTYPLQVMTGQTWEESIRIWIDYNNDGYYIPSEVVYEDSAGLYSHVGNATIQLPPGVNIPLRMRIMSELGGYPMPDGCSDVQFGHCYDYTVYVTPSTNVDDGFKEKGLTLYPNPAAEAFYLNDSENQILEMEIFNTTGQCFRTKMKIRNELVEVESPESPGIYFVTIKTNEVTVVRKLIVQ